ncbi:hypothetical protein [Bordetella genomosp. 11]|uniref:Novel toxin 16 domain-containing protein n=1 Tax=Bordetella genomosp. 11 TaxID=1416808 RepID=A0A261UG19_9BORD|nr:hypothetical protein [Bordetella genomosp. 11]OZI60854.1 hypothetical protein CAL28_15895 [Bordetella genomosp. 11]
MAAAWASLLAIQALAFLSPGVIAAPTVIVDGVPINMGLSAPRNPSSLQDCDAFRERMARPLQTLNDAHNRCLNASSSSSGSTGGNSGRRCALQRCERLHVMREALQEKAQDGYRQCRKALVPSDKNADNADHSREDHFFQIGEKLMAGPKEAASMVASDAMTDAFAKLLGVSKNTVNAAYDVPAKIVELAVLTRDVLKICQTTSPISQVRQACMAATRQSLVDFSLHAPLGMTSNPAIALIQTAMLERVNQIQNEVVMEFAKADKSMRDLNAQSEARPSSNASNGTPRRTTLPAGTTDECSKLDGPGRTELVVEHHAEYEALAARCGIGR